jgi:hypothetical protein
LVSTDVIDWQIPKVIANASEINTCIKTTPNNCKNLKLISSFQIPSHVVVSILVIIID